MLLVVYLHRQLDWIKNLQGDSPLGLSVTVFPERFDWVGRIYPECVSYQLQAGICGEKIGGKKGVIRLPPLMCHCFVTQDAMWPLSHAPPLCFLPPKAAFFLTHFRIKSFSFKLLLYVFYPRSKKGNLHSKSAHHMKGEISGRKRHECLETII